MATVTELNQYLGKSGMYFPDRTAFGVRVRVKGVKESWGNILVNIHPYYGTGNKWVNVGSVAFDEV